MADCTLKIYIVLWKEQNPAYSSIFSPLFYLIFLKSYFHVSFISRPLATSTSERRRAVRSDVECRRRRSYRGIRETRIALLLNSGIRHPVLDSYKGRIEVNTKSRVCLSFLESFAGALRASVLALNRVALLIPKRNAKFLSSVYNYVLRVNFLTVSRSKTENSR